MPFSKPDIHQTKLSKHYIKLQHKIMGNLNTKKQSHPYKMLTFRRDENMQPNIKTT